MVHHITWCVPYKKQSRLCIFNIEWSPLLLIRWKVHIKWCVPYNKGSIHYMCVKWSLLLFTCTWWKAHNKWLVTHYNNYVKYINWCAANFTWLKKTQYVNMLTSGHLYIPKGDFVIKLVWIPCCVVHIRK